MAVDYGVFLFLFSSSFFLPYLLLGILSLLFEWRGMASIHNGVNHLHKLGSVPGSENHLRFPVVYQDTSSVFLIFFLFSLLA